MIIGVPLLYTMEMWWIGMYIGGWRLVGFLVLALAINVGLNHATGYTQEGHEFRADLRHGVIALGASAVVALIVLVLISAVPRGYSFAASLGKVALAAIPVSLGFSIANTQFSGPADHGEEELRDEDPEKARAKADLLDIGITLAGSTIFVFAVAPTEEIPLIAARTSGWHWAGLVLFSLLLSYGIVFVAEFADGGKRQHHTRLQHPVPETLLAYLLSVGAGLLLLYLLGQTDAFASLSAAVGHAAVIGLPASVGGAAGRLLV
jgi:putative integral membrane protein (TIGR02587 family)